MDVLTLLELNPAKELVFTDASATIELKNPMTFGVAFKIKTTNPEAYVVKPAGGTVNAGDSLSVSVSQRRNEEGTPSAGDRFQVLATHAPTDGTDINAKWKSLPPSQIQETKLVTALGNNPVAKRTNLERSLTEEIEELKKELSDLKTQPIRKPTGISYRAFALIMAIIYLLARYQFFL